MFDGKITDYLEGLWKLGEKPLLVQIEQGKIEGWTKEEFKELMGTCFRRVQAELTMRQGGGQGDPGLLNPQSWGE